MRGLLALLRSLGFAWILLGLTLGGVALLEGAYVGQLALRARLFGSDEVREAQVEGHPYAGQAWYRDFLNARAALKEKYDPWRSYWAYGMSTEYLTVRPDGTRLTGASSASSVPPPAPSTRSAAPTVLFLGGSAMWGYTSRDSATIPSLVAAELTSSGQGADIRNLAQPGFTIGHELAALTYELNRGARPKVVVFYDGINDIRTAMLYGEPGHAFLEAKFGRLFEVDSPRGFFGAMLAPLERSALAARLLMAMGAPNPWAAKPHDPKVCPALGQYYADTARTVKGLAQMWDFSVLWVQQPHHASSKKTQTAFEATFMTPDDEMRWATECSKAVDVSMTAATVPYANHATLFDASTETVFIDRFGHVTEAANGVIAKDLAARVRTMLAGPRQPDVVSAHAAADPVSPAAAAARD